MKTCHFNHWIYTPEDAQHEYRQTLISSRAGINITDKQLKETGSIIAPQIKQGKSIYSVLQAHPEIELSEKTIYNYIESGAFQNVGIDLCALDLRRQVSRKITRKKSNVYKIRNDRTHLKGRLYTDYQVYMEENPNASVVEMDTVYNDISKGPFMQTFKFLNLGILFIVYHDTKTAQDMYEGILYLEGILGYDIFNREVNVILTDRGSEFTMAEQTENRSDGSMRTRVFYCDAMCSNQKGSLENQHELIRYVCPHNTDLRALGLTNQTAANKLASHINSYRVESLRGKSPFQYASFLAPDFVQKLLDAGLQEIPHDDVHLKPYLLKK
jgi:IS30 family transposase